MKSPNRPAGSLGSIYPGAHTSWMAMFRRCYEPANGSYERYGGAGVRVCERWRDFANFVDDMGERPDGKTIERMRSGEGYHPDNCRLATRSEQQRNRHNNRLATFGGRTQCLAAWCDEIGIEHHALQARLNRGWSDRAFTQPV